jgi:uncharacterized protein with PIN domain
MTKHNKSKEDDSRSQMGFYFSRTGSVDIQEVKFQMYCPQCRKMVDQTKSFQMKNGHYTDEPCVRCSKCGLVYDGGHYKKLMKEERSRLQKQEQSQQKLENKVLQNKGWKI